MRIERMPSAIPSPEPSRRPAAPSGEPQVSGPSFGEQVKNAVEHINDLQTKAGEEVTKVATGDVENVQKAIIAMEHASLAFNFGLQIRNKTLEAYQEIMRTQV